MHNSARLLFQCVNYYFIWYSKEYNFESRPIIQTGKNYFKKSLYSLLQRFSLRKMNSQVSRKKSPTNPKKEKNLFTSRKKYLYNV